MFLQGRKEQCRQRVRIHAAKIERLQNVDLDLPLTQFCLGYCQGAKIKFDNVFARPYKNGHFGLGRIYECAFRFHFLNHSFLQNQWPPEDGHTNR